MTNVATKPSLADDLWMATRSAQRDPARYIPPKDQASTMLSEVLRDTGRALDTKQSDLLGDAKTPGDLRIYYAGELALLKRPCVAIVGTRDVSVSGKAATEWLARKLVDAGIVVVSGLAYGVDTVAHTAAIEQGGKTIAVIGTPLDKASPSENAPLQERIYREHLLISRFRQGEKTFRSSFPLRNRLMAALSDATVVMEASDTSGTLHQAAECTRLGRWLFIAKSVVDDPKLTWPHKFLKYETCVVLERASQITERILTSSQ
ncbi:MAG TPA: DNA-processing protein DprA [Xanthobacteraceae bacterium]|nr:DNA-processing protein DprA [Xanthobacteraceae bacterium]